MSALDLDRTRDLTRSVIDEVERAIVGKTKVLELVFLGLLARGHVLLEDFPGLAKTLIARSFAQVLGIEFRRIQFTPDLLPADITGSYLYDQRHGIFELRKGPLFTNLLLGDEINRAPPKTQAAMLEAMQEGQVTIEDETHILPQPFVVIATENPIEYEGTYPLPEAQLDRFMLRIGVGYPSPAEELEIIKRRVDRRVDEVRLAQVIDAATIIGMQEALEDVHVSDAIGSYIVAIVTATRSHADVRVGSSPRGALAILKLARGKAVLEGRDFVTPEDVKAVAVPAVSHRLSLRPELWVRQITAAEVTHRILESVPTPSPEEAQRT